MALQRANKREIELEWMSFGGRPSRSFTLTSLRGTLLPLNQLKMIQRKREFAFIPFSFTRSLWMVSAPVIAFVCFLLFGLVSFGRSHWLAGQPITHPNNHQRESKLNQSYRSSARNTSPNKTIIPFMFSLLKRSLGRASAANNSSIQSFFPLGREEWMNLMSWLLARS